MIHKGQKFRKVGARGVGEVIGPRPRHENEWYLAMESGGKIESAKEQQLEDGIDWTFVSDDA